MGLLEKYNNYPLNEGVITKEEKIVFKIVDNLSDRRGLGSEWDNIDDDIQEEILGEWLEIVIGKLND